MAETKYTPSINIVRDRERDLVYIPTPNAQRVAKQIAADFGQGIRSFNIIGSYGTGKSAFLWALEQTLQGKKGYFDTGLIDKPNIEVLNFIGEYRSVSRFFADQFLNTPEIVPAQEILAEIYNRYHKLGKKNPLLVLVVDEFGKFLEYAAKHNPEQELFFLQQLAEFVNNPDYNIVLLTTLHQNFDAYSFILNAPQRQEWTKVKGRFREITFNEPVEQLLYLAGERLSQSPEIAPKNLSKQVNLFLGAQAFTLKSDYARDLANKLLPMDLFAASVVTLALQKYGQNERSLFSFLESTDFTGIRQFDRSNPFYNLSNVYDYLVFNFYSYLTSGGNLDRTAWAAIHAALERVENEVDEHQSDCQKMIKTIGLLNLFASQGAKMEHSFLIGYGSQCLGLKDAEKVLDLLIKRKIILHRNYANRFVLFEGTDIDIHGELLSARDRVEEISDISTLLNRYFNFQPVFAKQYFYLYGTPRVFEFVISQTPKTNLIPRGETDGYINLIFNERLKEEDVRQASQAQEEAVIYGFYRNSQKIKDLLFDIERAKKALENVPTEDKVARRELLNIQQHQESLLNHYIAHNLYSNNSDVTWYFGGQPLAIHNKRTFNTMLTQICGGVYSGTPAFKNELVNRSKLTSQIQTAKLTFLKHLVQYWGKEDLGFPIDKFPPEKTIYLTLLKENGLVPDPTQPEREVSVQDGSTFGQLWQYCEGFLESAKQHRRRVSDLTDALAKRPFKLKQGLIDFWLPSFLFIKRDEFALFGPNGYIPTLTEDSLDLLIRKPGDFEIKTFDIAGVRLEIFNSYRQFLSQAEQKHLNNLVFVETIRPFLSFYRGLPDYAKHTKRLKKTSLAIRDAIAIAKDPEKTFFEDFPTALRTSISKLKQSPEALEQYVADLQEAIREVRACYSELVNRFETYICEEVLYSNLDFEAYKARFQERFKAVKQHLLLPHQKTFLLRIQSELEDREAWLSSVAQAVLGKPLKQIRDEDELALFDKFKNSVMELDNLTQISKTTANETQEEVFGLEITTFEKIEKKIVRFPKKKQTEIEHIENALKMHLGKDKTLNIAALANVLKDLLKQ